MSEFKTNQLKILNDPIYGFITIPNTLIFDLIEHPYFQRLRRISQMGMSYLVYPGAHHTRFHHAIGCLYLMQKAVRVLRFKGIQITEDEENAVYVAILLHDIGHGPFSHALELSIVENISHEEISLKFMEVLNDEFAGKLSLAISIFKGVYHKKFLNQLISSQLDMDRLDYLRRDSFYTGVAEGTISSDRLIAMLNVKNDELVVDEKGIYSVEKFIIARRLMYWQVYLHKTGFVAEQILTKILKRARELVIRGIDINVGEPFNFFLHNKITKENCNENTIVKFSKLDDYDILYAIKQWTLHDDIVLSELSKMIIDRKLPKIIIQNEKFSDDFINTVIAKVERKYKLSAIELDYFVFNGTLFNQAYDSNKDQIKLLSKDGKLNDIAKASDHLNIQSLSNKVIKYFICYPKNS